MKLFFNNPKLNEINNIIKNTQLKNEQKHGYNYYRKVNVNYNVKFFDKIENKTKITMIERDNIVGEVNKRMHLSKGMYDFIRAHKWTLITQRRNYKNVVNAYLKCDKIPVLWKNFSLKIGHDGSCESTLS